MCALSDRDIVGVGWVHGVKLQQQMVGVLTQLILAFLTDTVISQQNIYHPPREGSRTKKVPANFQFYNSTHKAWDQQASCFSAVFSSANEFATQLTRAASQICLGKLGRELPYYFSVIFVHLKHLFNGLITSRRKHGESINYFIFGSLIIFCLGTKTEDRCMVNMLIFSMPCQYDNYPALIVYMMS